MTISLHRTPAAPPVHTGTTYCHMCWTPPGREHGLACPAAPHNRPLPFPENARVFAGLLIGIPLGAALWTVALIARSLA